MTNPKREEEGEMSIEEILASIRRYVGDEPSPVPEKTFPTTKAEADRAAEVLAASLSTGKPDSTTVETSPASSVPPVASVLPSMPPENVIRLTEAHAVRPDLQGSPNALAAQEGLLSQQNQTAAFQAFSRLAEVASQSRHQTASLAPSASPTLDQLITDLARPLIKQWIDQNLSRLVEVMIAKEIERLTHPLHRG